MLVRYRISYTKVKKNTACNNFPPHSTWNRSEYVSAIRCFAPIFQSVVRPPNHRGAWDTDGLRPPFVIQLTRSFASITEGQSNRNRGIIR